MLKLLLPVISVACRSLSISSFFSPPNQGFLTSSRRHETTREEDVIQLFAFFSLFLLIAANLKSDNENNYSCRAYNPLPVWLNWKLLLLLLAEGGEAKLISFIRIN